jgi:hypothetical protein
VIVVAGGTGTVGRQVVTQTITPAVQDLTGVPARSFAQWAADNAASFG